MRLPQEVITCEGCTLTIGGAESQRSSSAIPDHSTRTELAPKSRLAIPMILSIVRSLGF
jgi:hypothetical protein